MIERRRDIGKETLFIAPESGILTDLICKNGCIYKASLIHEHAQHQAHISDASLKKHILIENIMGKLHINTENEPKNILLLVLKVMHYFMDKSPQI